MDQPGEDLKLRLHRCNFPAGQKVRELGIGLALGHVIPDWEGTGVLPSHSMRPL